MTDEPHDPDDIDVNGIDFQVARRFAQRRIVDVRAEFERLFANPRPFDPFRLVLLTENCAIIQLTLMFEDEEFEPEGWKAMDALIAYANGTFDPSAYRPEPLDYLMTSQLKEYWENNWLVEANYDAASDRQNDIDRDKLPLDDRHEALWLFLVALLFEDLERCGVPAVKILRDWMGQHLLNDEED